tara:strand:+ start:1202 stop:1462 length:261 start_codon:yes stop_codon:yes gene_type:complete
MGFYYIGSRLWGEGVENEENGDDILLMVRFVFAFSKAGAIRKETFRLRKLLRDQFPSANFEIELVEESNIIQYLGYWSKIEQSNSD